MVDNYALDIQWKREIRPFADEIFVIDDLANRVHDCDILLDKNFYLNIEERYIGLVPGKCELLLGAVMRPFGKNYMRHAGILKGELINCSLSCGLRREAI